MYGAEAFVISMEERCWVSVERTQLETQLACSTLSEGEISWGLGDVHLRHQLLTPALSVSPRPDLDQESDPTFKSYFFFPCSRAVALCHCQSSPQGCLSTSIQELPGETQLDVITLQEIFFWGAAVMRISYKQTPTLWRERILRKVSYGKVMAIDFPSISVCRLLYRSTLVYDS